MASSAYNTGSDEQSKALRDLKLRIMCVGDSITTGCEPFENSYRKDLLDSLEATNKITYVGPKTWGSMDPPSQNNIDAMMGLRIEQTHTALQKSLPEYKPDVILLHTGTNDVAPHEKWPPECPSQVDDILAYVHRTAPNCTLLVAAIIPAAFRGPQIDHFNSEVKAKLEVRVQQGMKIEMVDMFTDWPDGTLRDLAHPNGIGYEEIARRWKSGLERVNGKGWLS